MKNEDENLKQYIIDFIIVVTMSICLYRIFQPYHYDYYFAYYKLINGL